MNKKVVVIIVIIISIITAGIITYKITEKHDQFYYQIIGINNASHGYVLFPEVVNQNNEPVIDNSSIQIYNGSCNLSREIINGNRFFNITCESKDVTLWINLTTLPSDWKHLNYSGFRQEGYHYYAPVYYSGNNSVYVTALIHFGYDKSVYQNQLSISEITHGWNEVFNHWIYGEV